jgi:hypothetical protein
VPLFSPKPWEKDDRNVARRIKQRTSVYLVRQLLWVLALKDHSL